MPFPEKLTVKIPRNSFVTKLFATYLVLMMLPLSLILLINYYRSAQISEEQAIYSNEKVISQTSDFLSYKVSSLKNIIDIISFDENVQTVLKTSDSFYRNNKGYWTIQTEDIKNIIYNSYTTSDITTVRLYMRKGPASFEETDNFKRLSNAEQSDWYTRIENSSLLNTVWIPSSFFDPGSQSPYISIVKRIPDLNSINKYIGVITGTVPQDVFQQIIAKMTTTKNTTVALYNFHNEMITATGDSTLTNVRILNGIINENNLPADGTMHKVSISNNDYLVGVHNIEHADWKLVMLVPNGDILTSAYLYRNQLFWIVLILFLFSPHYLCYILQHNTPLAQAQAAYEGGRL
ncbi:MAG: integral rane sensor signal transduction histidine kinase [Eubacterium sp.]|nr:integral rane sensor signal transduction histidine kinase [Eubacterium sp.]